MEAYEANSPAAQASKLINHTNKHIFLTGKAGTGKTTFLRHILQHTHKKAVVCAPTGIAAINAGGVTIHSLFQLGFGAFVPDANFVPNVGNASKFTSPKSVMNGFKMTETKRRLLREMELLIIDEVSMLRADILDAIDAVCRIVRRRNNQAFGGVQVLFIGDLLQLPPVVKEDEWDTLRNYYRSIYFFDAWALEYNKPVYVELDKIYRQQDEIFISILNNLRQGIVAAQDIAVLNKHYNPHFRSSKENNYITLTTHNAKADNLNRMLLQELETPSFYFEARVEDDFGENLYPLEKRLELKLGAQVMFVKNDPQKRYFNGKIAVVCAIDANSIEVITDDSDEPISVETHTWENIKYVLNAQTNVIEEEVIGTFCHYPIKLAWAITVHKSQGLTFEKAIVDIGQAFAPGQVYVALSRLKSLDGLVMSSYINQHSLTQDATITEYGTTKDSQESLERLIEKETPIFLHNQVIQSYDFTELYNAAQIHQASYNAQSEEKSAKQKYHPWSKEFVKTIEEMHNVALKFMNEIQKIIATNAPNYVEMLVNRTSAAEGYFVPRLKKESQAILDLLQKLKEEKKVKGYATELQDLEAIVYKQQANIQKAGAFCLAVHNNTEYTKAENAKVIDSKQRSLAIEIANTKFDKDGKASKPAKNKANAAPVGSTKSISFDMFKAGKSITEIAAERDLVVGTIEQHLSQYVRTGELAIDLFLSTERLEMIASVMTEENKDSRSLIKQALPEDFTYGEIGFAMAHFEFILA